MENNFHKIQINCSEDRTSDGVLIKTGSLINIQTNDVEEAVQLYRQLQERLGIEKRDNTCQTNKKSQEALPKCPKCQSPMILRQNGQKGTFFFGCVRYPLCRGTKPHSEDIMQNNLEVVEVG